MHDPRRHDGAAVGGICLAAGLFGLEISSVPTALPEIGIDLDAPFALLSWVATAYTVAVAAVLMASGALGDRFGHRRVLAWSVAGFGLTSLLCATAPEIEVLVAARFAQGAVGGALLTCQLAALSVMSPSGPRRNRAFGLWGTAFGSGLGLGPLIGAGLVELAGWRLVFWVPAVLAVPCWALVLRGLPPSRSVATGPLDWPGIALMAAGVLALAGGTSHGGQVGFTDPVTLAVLAAAVLLLAAFVLVERRPTAQLLSGSVLRRPAFGGALAGSVGMNTSFWPLVVYLPLHLEHALGLDVLQSGAALLALTLPTLLLPPVAERLTERWSAARTVPSGLAVIAAGCAGLWVATAAAPDSWWALLPGMLVAGIGVGLTNTPVTNTATGAVPPDQAGLASGMDMTARMVTLAVAIAGFGVLITTGAGAALRSEGLPATTADATAQLVVTGAVAAPAALGAGMQLVLTVATLLVAASALVSRRLFTLSAVRDPRP